MEIRTLISHVNFLVQKSLGVWLSVWAIRHKADLDYRLSDTAKLVRWAVVGIGYLLAASVPGPAIVRLVPGSTGLLFLCWPNLAYHLTNLFVAWPTTEGCVVSVAQIDSGWAVSYSFEHGGEMFGGTTTIKESEHLRTDAPYSEGQLVMVGYDPLNPDQSKAIPRNRPEPR